MYSIILLWVAILTLIAILLKLLNIKKNYIFSFLITLLIVFFAINVEASIKAALDGARLVFTAIFPTIFPFTVICNLLISYDGIGLYSKILGPLCCKPLRLSRASSFPLVASFISGYPLGAKYSSDIYSLNYIERDEYLRLLNIATNAGPIFLLGTVGAAMLNNTFYGYILLIANYLSIFIVGFLTIKKKKKGCTSNIIPSNNTKNNFGTNLKKAVENAISTTITVGAFVIIFSIIISLIRNNQFVTSFFQNIESFLNLPKDSLYGLFLGSIEMTNGCKIISSSALPVELKLASISFLCSFSGFSIIAQVSSFISEYNVSLIKYSLIKLLQGLFSFGITYIASKIILSSSYTFQGTAKAITYSPIILTIAFLSILTILCTLINKLLNKLHASKF